MIYSAADVYIDISLHTFAISNYRVRNDIDIFLAYTYIYINIYKTEINGMICTLDFFTYRVNSNSFRRCLNKQKTKERNKEKKNDVDVFDTKNRKMYVWDYLSCLSI